MPKKKHIEAKPTIYRGVTYRSRLEARFACCLDNCSNVITFQYEPRKFLLPQKNWDYTPDFRITLFAEGVKGNAYFEVKPKMPNEEYRRTCQQFSKVMDHPFWLVAVDFRDGQCLSIGWNKGRCVIVGMTDLFPNWVQAAQIAAQYRFDL